jgi:DNA end-binding protein Ku
MTARAIWKASLALGGTVVPVKLYAAVEERDIHFRLLHVEDRAPVRQRMVDPRTDEEVPPESIRRGVAVEPGTYVLMKPEEVERQAPEPSRTIELMRFVPPRAIDPAWYSRPYTLGPDGSNAAYAALVKALQESELRGIARWVMRGNRYFGALAAHEEGHLTLVTMRSPDEVVTAEQLPPGGGKAMSAAEHALAQQLVSALDGPFEPAALRDDYHDRLAAYLAARAKGRRVRPPREALPKPSHDLARALEQSVRSVRKRRAA